jgi:hypothetical protein
MAIKHHTYELAPWREEVAKSFWAKVYVAGEMEAALRICREYCLEIGLCVTVTPTEYIYTGGAEKGFEVGLIQYTPFETTPEEIFNKAKELGKRLAEENCQWSYTILTPEGSHFFSRRKRKD